MSLQIIQKEIWKNQIHDTVLRSLAESKRRGYKDLGELFNNAAKLTEESLVNYLCGTDWYTRSTSVPDKLRTRKETQELYEYWIEMEALGG